MRNAVALGLTVVLGLFVACSSAPPAKEGDSCNSDGGEIGNYCIGGQFVCVPSGSGSAGVCHIPCPVVTLPDGGFQGEQDVDAGCPSSESCNAFDNSVGFCQ